MTFLRSHGLLVGWTGILLVTALSIKTGLALRPLGGLAAMLACLAAVVCLGRLTRHP